MLRARRRTLPERRSTLPMLSVSFAYQNFISLSGNILNKHFAKYFYSEVTNIYTKNIQQVDKLFSSTMLSQNFH